MPRPKLLACLAAIALPWAAHTAAQGEPNRWNFAVTLDGKPIGEHVFTLASRGTERRVTSTARYRVKLFGVTVYRYDHHAEEYWVDRCLDRLDAHTDDDGQRNAVRGRADGGSFVWQVRSDAGASPSQHAECPMSFAYWNPDIASRNALLDPGSGRLEPVRIQTLAPTTIEVHGAPARVRGLRIDGLQHPIDVWYQGDDWVGLDTTVANGRTLRYRLP